MSLDNLVLIVSGGAVPFRGESVPPCLVDLLNTDRIKQVVCVGNSCAQYSETSDLLSKIAPGSMVSVKGDFDSDSCKLKEMELVDMGAFKALLLNGYQVVPKGDVNQLLALQRKFGADVIITGDSIESYVSEPAPGVDSIQEAQGHSEVQASAQADPQLDSESLLGTATESVVDPATNEPNPESEDLEQNATENTATEEHTGVEGESGDIATKTQTVSPHTPVFRPALPCVPTTGSFMLLAVKEDNAMVYVYKAAQNAKSAVVSMVELVFNRTPKNKQHFGAYRH